MTPAELVVGSDAVILDFDGPMCSAFSSITAAEAADQLRTFVQAHPSTDRDIDLPDDDDPLGVLRAAADFSPELGWIAAHRLTLIELEAVVDASPIEGLEDILVRLRNAQIQVAVASNNSSAAIEWWIERNGFGSVIAEVVGRRHDGLLLKPDPYILSEACRVVGVLPKGAVFIGDSLSDFEAAEALGIPFVGFAKNAEKTRAFIEAGNDLNISSLSQLRSQADGVGLERPLG